MKKIISVIIVFLSLTPVHAQNLFGKNPYLNLQNWDKKRIDYGYFLGFNSYNFKYNFADTYYKKYGNNPILVTSQIGFNVGFVVNLRLIEHLDLRFEPGLYFAKRTLFYPHVENKNLRTKELGSTYIHMPLLLKFSALRAGNVRPYMLAGVSESLNLSSRQNSKEDNYAGTFRMKKWTSNYELGLGVDLYFTYFKFSPSIRGVFGLQDEMIRDYSPNSQFTGNIESLQTRAIFVNFTFH